MDEIDDRSEEQLSGTDYWPMGAVSRRTGLSEHTLRAWERRFGFPDPERLPSGHRRYPTEQVQRLLLIARVLEHGHRAGDVVPLPAEELAALLRDSQDRRGLSPQEASRRWVDRVVRHAAAMDSTGLDALLAVEAARLGLERFLRERVVPLLEAVGERWARGELAIRHEHLISEQLGDTLRSLRSGLERATGGRPVVLSCLPGELHTLGLQLAALEIASAGRAVRLLGGPTPVDEILASASSSDAAAVALSVSPYAAPEVTTDALTALRAGLPTAVPVWVGGGGATALRELPPGVEALADLDALAAALRDLAGRDPIEGTELS